MHVEWSAGRFAAALAGVMDAAGLAQRDVARIAGVNRSQVNRWSRGENKPSYDNVRRVALAVFREHPELAQRLMTAAGYGMLTEADRDAAPPPDITPEDEWEARVLADPGLPYEERAQIIRISRKARADLYPAPAPRSAGGGPAAQEPRTA